MTTLIICDYCGEEIDRKGGKDQFITINAQGDKGGPKRERWKDGYVGHYHGEPCWSEVFEAIRAIHEQGGSLEAIPTATPEQVASLNPADHEGESPFDGEPLWDVPPGTFRPGRLRTFNPQLKARGLDLTECPTTFNCYSLRDTGRHETVGDLRRDVESGGLRSFPGVGPKTFDWIKQRLEAFLGGEPLTGKTAMPSRERGGV